MHFVVSYYSTAEFHGPSLINGCGNSGTYRSTVIAQLLQFIRRGGENYPQNPWQLQVTFPSFPDSITHLQCGFAAPALHTHHRPLDMVEPTYLGIPILGFWWILSGQAIKTKISIYYYIRMPRVTLKQCIAALKRWFRHNAVLFTAS